MNRRKSNMFKNLKNKKGFTLIEMLVVIAIIAVLVAIIIPTVTSATTKATAAANAANLRSLKAEIQVAILSGDFNASTNGGWTITLDTNGDGTATGDATKLAKSFKNYADGDFVATIDNSVVTVTYDSKSINDWATIAEKGKS